MKIMLKILLSIFLIVSFFLVIPNNIVKGVTSSSIIDEVGGKVQGVSTEASGAMSDIVSRVLGFLQITSALIAVVMIATMGFRYIIDTPEVKEEIKKNMIPVVVGIILVFSAVSIAKFFVGIFDTAQGGAQVIIQGADQGENPDGGDNNSND